MYIWGQQDPPPTTAPRNPREQATVAAKAGDWKQIAALTDKEWAEKARNPPHPAGPPAPVDIRTTSCRSFIVNDQEETFRCPRCPDRIMVLFHGETQECPGGHLIELLGATIQTWNSKRRWKAHGRLRSRILNLLNRP